MKLSILNKTIFFFICLLLFAVSALSGQALDITGTARAGSYQMGTVKMIPAGSGFKSIRFENANEVLAKFNASVGSSPPSFEVGQVKIGNFDIRNPSASSPNHLFFNNGNTSVLSIGLTGSSMTTNQFQIWGSLDVRHNTTGGANDGIKLSQRQFPYHHWRIYTAPGTSNLEFYLNGTLKGRINASNGSYTSSSDVRLKSAIEALKPALFNVLKLQAKSYVFKDVPDAERSIGFIAQEVAELFPELVDGDPSSEATLSLDYSGLGVLAIKAIQEQQLIINKLERRLEALEGL